MLICAAGDIHGALDRMYDDVRAFEVELGVEFDWLLHVGDFGIWPDPSRVDKATARHEGAGDFPRWWAERRAAPKPTVFIKGNHEDFLWLEAQPESEVLPGLHYLRNGTAMDLGGVAIGGVGGCYGPSNFEREAHRLQGYAKRHYTRDEIERLVGSGQRVDVLLTHDAPAGVVFPRHRRGDNWPSEAAGLDELVRGTRPRVCFFGHHHQRVDGMLHGVPCFGLSIVGRPGNMVAIEVAPKRSGFSVLGEWPQASTG